MRMNSGKSAFISCETAELHLPYAEFAGTLEQSPNDPRQHKLICLPNNLVVLCTHDASTVMSAATMGINIGSFVDPPELQGLAHLLEHMLFMGSANYPDENVLKSYCSNNGGFHNACTFETLTAYYFSVANNALEGALDRFADAFISPLFSADCVDREVNAVDSEFQSLLHSSESWLQQLRCAMKSKTHPGSNFNAGNLETLKTAAQGLGLNLHEQVMELFQQYYSADIMKLTIVGSHPIDQLVEWAVAKFSGIHSKGNTKLQASLEVYSCDMLGKVIHYQSGDNEYLMDVEFVLPGIQQHYRTNPMNYYASLINLKSKGSLLDYLKRQGLATDIDCSIAYPLYDGFNSLTTIIHLTSHGVGNYEYVLNALFAYLETVISKGPLEWYYQELVQKQKLKFQFYEAMMLPVWGYFINFGAHNEYMLPERYLCYDTCANQYDADLLCRFARYLCPKNCQVFVGAPEHPYIVLDQKEKYYSTNYHVMDIPLNILNETQFAREEFSFALPLPNQFLPKSLSIAGKASKDKDGAAAPTLLQKTSVHELWFKCDDQFMTPHAYIYLLVQLPSANVSARDWAIMDVIDSCISNMLAEYLDDASSANYMFKVECTVHQVAVKVSGFSDRLCYLLEVILAKLKECTIDKQMLDSSILQVARHYNELLTKQPFEQLEKLKTDQLLTMPCFSTANLQHSLDSITVESVQQRVDGLFSHTYSKLLVNGNFTEPAAIEVADKITSIMGSKPLSTNLAHVPALSTYIPPGSYIYSLQTDNESSSFNAAQVTIFCGPVTNTWNLVAIEVISHIFSHKFYNQLRTQEQLGYVVQSYHEFQDNGSICLVMIVQGRDNPVYLTQRIDSFIREFRQMLVDYPMQDFAQVVATAIVMRRTAALSLHIETLRFWNCISKGEYDFGSRERKARQVEKLTKQDLVDVWDMFINPETAVDYTRVDMHMWSAELGCPSSKILCKYPEYLLSLAGCLQSDGISGVDLKTLHLFIERAACDKHLESALNELRQLYAQSGSNIAESAKTKTALACAIASFNQHTEQPQARHANMDMHRTPEGKWIINGICKFKDAQSAHGIASPAIKLEPKFADQRSS